MKKFNLNIQLFADPTDYTQSVQKMYDTNLTAFSKELKGQGLKKGCQIKTEAKGDTISFYRRGAGKSGSGAVPSMFPGGATSNQGGKPQSFIATITKIWSQQHVEKSDMNKTGLDIKGATIISMGDEILRTEDKMIMAAVYLSPGIALRGDVTLDIDSEQNIRALVGTCRRAALRAKQSVAGNTKPAQLAISLDHYEKICSHDIFINGDYKNALGDGMSNFFGAELRITDAATAPTVIPPEVIGWGEWEGTMENSAVYFPTDGEKWHIQSVKSGGVVVIEPELITKLQFKTA
ncbi:MAG: hypothetical protein ACRCXX_06175 [Cetobacterium sp.]|uniref:hypothetical protein n=1 Tax=Cetobacterium sp. TaxID=2071632 RepID=UPI003F3F46FF